AKESPTPQSFVPRRNIPTSAHLWRSLISPGIAARTANKPERPTDNLPHFSPVMSPVSTAPSSILLPQSALKKETWELRSHRRLPTNGRSEVVPVVKPSMSTRPVLTDPLARERFLLCVVL